VFVPYFWLGDLEQNGQDGRKEAIPSRLFGMRTTRCRTFWLSTKAAASTMGWLAATVMGSGVATWAAVLSGARHVPFGDDAWGVFDEQGGCVLVAYQVGGSGQRLIASYPHSVADDQEARRRVKLHHLQCHAVSTPTQSRAG
jgi:hypothetical protein